MTKICYYLIKYREVSNSDKKNDVPFVADPLLEALSTSCPWADDFLPVPVTTVWLPPKLGCRVLACMGDFLSSLLSILLCSSRYAWGILTCAGTNLLMADSWSGEIEVLFTDVAWVLSAPFLVFSCIFCLLSSKSGGFTELSWFLSFLMCFWMPSLGCVCLLLWGDFWFFLGWVESDDFEAASLIEGKKKKWFSMLDQ